MEINGEPNINKVLIEKERLVRCVDWLQKQNCEPNRLLLQNKNQNDIQFIVENNKTRKDFLLSTSVDDLSVPAGVNEDDIRPVRVHRRKLRNECLSLECEWQLCGTVMPAYEAFLTHVKTHINDVHVIKVKDETTYTCLWDICGHKTSDSRQIVRHVNYHAYHARLLAIGFNGRASLNLSRCKKSSKNRNQLPPLLADHVCLWVGCSAAFNCMQTFLAHVNDHVQALDIDKAICSWAGCGMRCTYPSLVKNHMKVHTGERHIACYHCGAHFFNFRKLSDHIHRQNAEGSGYICSMCGAASGTAHLLRQHERQHVSQHMCSYCDMSMPTLGSLANHVRFRHLPDSRHFACTLCPYKGVRKFDLKAHLARHERRKAKQENTEHSDLSEMSEDEGMLKSTTKEVKRFCCHMCPDNQKVYCRGARLTKHLIKMHGIQVPCGHSRFRYQISSDGMYRLTTTRYESLEVSRQIMERRGVYPPPSGDGINVQVELVRDATVDTPRQLAVTLSEDPPICEDMEMIEPNVEITMCDVDEYGNIISSKVFDIDSDNIHIEVSKTE